MSNSDRDRINNNKIKKIEESLSLLDEKIKFIFKKIVNISDTLETLVSDRVQPPVKPVVEPSIPEEPVTPPSEPEPEPIQFFDEPVTISEPEPMEFIDEPEPEPFHGSDADNVFLIPITREEREQNLRNQSKKWPN